MSFIFHETVRRLYCGPRCFPVNDGWLFFPGKHKRSGHAQTDKYRMRISQTGIWGEFADNWTVRVAAVCYFLQFSTAAKRHLLASFFFFFFFLTLHLFFFYFFEKEYNLESKISSTESVETVFSTHESSRSTSLNEDYFPSSWYMVWPSWWSGC